MFIHLLCDNNKTIISLRQLDINDRHTVRGMRYAVKDLILGIIDAGSWIKNKKVRRAAWGVSAYVSIAGSFH